MLKQMLFACGLAVTTAALSGQQAQKPGDEHKRIQAFAGTWQYQGETRASPLGPAGKVTRTETCDWFAGRFQMVCRSKGTGPGGAMTGMNILGYDAARKAYTFYAISSTGTNLFVRGSVSGNTWTWTDEWQLLGQPVQVRATMIEESPTAYTLRMEAGMGGGQMVVIEEGRATRLK